MAITTCMKKSDSIGKLALALSKAQAEMKAAIKDAENPFFKSKYANLESVWEAVRRPLADNELSVSQLTEYVSDAKCFCIITMIMHSSGEYVSGEYPLIAKDNSAQAMGSATSYGRRYALEAALGVSRGDDDGEHAQLREAPRNHIPIATSGTEAITALSAFPGSTVTPSNRNCPECGKKMLPSKFKEGEMWCPNRKNHKDQQQDTLPMDWK